MFYLILIIVRKKLQQTRFSRNSKEKQLAAFSNDGIITDAIAIWVCHFSDTFRISAQIPDTLSLAAYVFLLLFLHRI